MDKKQKLILSTAIIILACFGFARETLATYYTSGNFTSINLLSGQTVTSIDSFVYNLSAKPTGTEATVQFSQNSSTWYNSSGTEGGTDTLTTGANNTIDLSGLGWSGPNFYYKVAFTSDGTDTPVLDDITVNYTSNTAPSAPSTHYTNESFFGASSGESNPVAVGDETPVFSAVYVDSDSGDVADYFQLIVYCDAACSTQVWDSTKTWMTNCTEGNHCSDIDFAGTPLKFNGKKYYWKIKFWDDDGAEGTYSDCSDNFTMLGPGDQMRHGKYFFNKKTERVFTW